MLPALTFVLLHSPVVGPFTWGAVARELRGRGMQVIVPSLVDALRRPPPFWQQMAEASARAVRAASPAHPPIFVGHSGAGPLLPVMRSALGGPVGAYVFVDAGLPRSASTGFERMPAVLADRLQSLVRDGCVPRWSDWWGDEAVRMHLPDDEMRACFLAELRPLPLALFEERLPVTGPWPDAPCAYLQLSPGYDAEAAEARRQKWPDARLNSHHLGLPTEPVAISDALLAMLPRQEPAVSASP